MKIVERYILREFLKVFFLTSFSFLLVDVLIEFLDKADRLLKTSSSGEIIEYFAYHAPSILYQTAPVAVLLAALVSLGSLTKHNEITAIRANGIAVLRAAAPVVAFAALITGLFLIANEYVMPQTNRRAAEIKREKVEGKGPAASVNVAQGRLWYRGDGTIFTVRRASPSAGVINGLTVFEFDKDYAVSARIDADEVVWKEGRWVAGKGTRRRFDGPRVTDERRIDGQEIRGILAGPSEFERHESISDAMSISELRAYADKLAKEGYDATTSLMDLHNKLSFPFINIVFALLALPFALKTGRHGGITAGIGISVAVAFSYWIIFASSTMLGNSGALPPILAAWTANVLLGSAGAIMLTYVRQ